MKTGWTIIPAVLFGLALVSEPVMLVPGSYFSGVGEAEYDRLAESMNKQTSEIRDNVSRARVGRRIEVPADADHSAYLFRVRHDGHFLVRGDTPSMNMTVSYIEPGSNRLRRAASSRSQEARLSLEAEGLIYVEVRGANRQSGTRSFEITEPLRDSRLDSSIKEVLALGWEDWEIDPASLTVVTPGEPVTGRLEEGGRVFYVVEATTYAPFRINLDSDEFDPYLELWEVGASGVIEEHTNDDGGEGNNSMLRLPPNELTTHLVVMVRGYGEDDEGQYRLRIRQPAPRRGGWTPLEVAREEGLEVEEVLDGALGVREEGFLNAGDEIFYLFDVSGRDVDIDVTSDDFDTYVEVWAIDTEGGFLSDQETNDDGGSGQNSRIEGFEVDARSVLLVKVRGYSSSNEGQFELYVR